MSDDEDSWANARPNAKAAALGASKDLLRKARAVNPELASQGSTTELFDKVQAARAVSSGSEAAKAGAKPTAKSAATKQAPAHGDFFSGFYAHKERFVEERERLLQEKARIDGALQTLAPEACDALIDLLLSTDPSIANPQTQDILQREQSFLGQIGFSHRKVVDRRLQKK